MVCHFPGAKKGRFFFLEFLSFAGGESFISFLFWFFLLDRFFRFFDGLFLSLFMALFKKTGKGKKNSPRFAPFYGFARYFCLCGPRYYAGHSKNCQEFASSRVDY